MLKEGRTACVYFTIAIKSIPDSLHKIHWILKHKPAVIISRTELTSRDSLARMSLSFGLDRSSTKIPAHVVLQVSFATTTLPVCHIVP